MQYFRYKIINRALRTGEFILKLSDGRIVRDKCPWVRFAPKVGDTGVIETNGTLTKMIPDAYDPE